MKRRLNTSVTDDETFCVKRRELSKSAARCRRRVEANAFTDLAVALPFDHSERPVYQMDRIAILRLVVTYYKLLRFAENLSMNDKCDAWLAIEANRLCDKHIQIEKYELSDEQEDLTGLREEFDLDSIVDGFLIIIELSGCIVYVSNAVSTYIGFTQADLMGRSFKDYVHAEDWSEFKMKLALKTIETFFFRMKTALTPRGGRSRKITTAVSHPMKVTVTPFDYNSKSGFYVHCTPVINVHNHGTKQSFDSLMTRHEVDMKIRYSDEKLAYLLGYKNSKSLIGKSFYEFVHPNDVNRVASSFKQLYLTDFCLTDCYRVLTNNGNYIWIITEASFCTQNVRGTRQHFIFCNHQIVSNVENELDKQSGCVIEQSNSVKIIKRERSKSVKPKIKEETIHRSCSSHSSPSAVNSFNGCNAKYDLDVFDISGCENIESVDFNNFDDLDPSCLEWAASELTWVDDNKNDLAYLAPYFGGDVLDLKSYDDDTTSQLNRSTVNDDKNSLDVNTDMISPQTPFNCSCSSNVGANSPTDRAEDCYEISLLQECHDADEVRIQTIKNSLIESVQRFLHN